MTLFPRSSGILLHPTSLPGRYGIGDLGAHAYRFVDWLVEHGQTIWQVLPLGPTSYGDSPYQTLSAFAGNPNLISLDQLIDDGLLTKADLADAPAFPTDHVDFGWITPYHNEKLHIAYQTFKKSKDKTAFEAFCNDHAHWLDDFALFIALKNNHNLRPWVEWEPELALRDKRAITKAIKQYADEIQEQQFRQWVFHTQWDALKTYANDNGVRLFGDLPIFVAHDSSDVWANQSQYFLDDSGNTTVIAGVPPDYFSPTGQRWGNPLYRWDVMKKDGYSWWIERFKAILSTVDYIRIDHFRGFEAYWEIPASEETAINGEWVDGPKEHFFQAIKDALGELPVIAEDLGVITEGVEKLRDDFDLPGMKVLQFAWGEPTNPFLPHNHPVNSVVYTGTHDNNTTVGWFNEEVDDSTLGFMKDYLGQDVHDIVWTLARVGMRSSGHTFIMPMQDVLGLGSEGRMNTPGKLGGNWTWRFDEAGFNRVEPLMHITWLFQRHPDQQEKVYGDAAIKND
jgi:4-alpha-glucanotransferase